MEVIGLMISLVSDAYHITPFSGAGSGYVCVAVMSEMFACGSDARAGRRASLNWVAFSLLVVAISFIVGM